MATEKRLVSYPDRTVISTTGELVCRLGSRVATDWGRFTGVTTAVTTGVATGVTAGYMRADPAD